MGFLGHRVFLGHRDRQPTGPPHTIPTSKANVEGRPKGPDGSEQRDAADRPPQRPIIRLVGDPTSRREGGEPTPPPHEDTTVSFFSYLDRTEIVCAPGSPWDD